MVGDTYMNNRDVLSPKQQEAYDKIIKHHDLKNEFVTLEDGYVYYWPTDNCGAIPAYALRFIADELDKRNAEWDKQIQDFHNEQS